MNLAAIGGAPCSHTAMADHESERVMVGRISGLFGVRGWVRVFSYTEPRENILRYNPWQVRLGDEWRSLEVAEGRRHGKGVIARLAVCRDRDAAAAFLGADIAVRRDQLPALGQGEYYWTDLEGLKVVTLDNMDLGVVDHLIETGSNDVLVVKGEQERLIPYLPERVVKDVDLEAGVVRVDWDPDF